MGIGEPLDNYDNVIKAISIINNPKGLNILVPSFDSSFFIILKLLIVYFSFKTSLNSLEIFVISSMSNT